MTYEVSLSEKEMELLECSLRHSRDRWLKAAQNAMAGKNDLPAEDCLLRCSEYESLSVHLAVAKGFGKKS